MKNAIRGMAFTAAAVMLHAQTQLPPAQGTTQLPPAQGAAPAGAGATALPPGATPAPAAPGAPVGGPAAAEIQDMQKIQTMAVQNATDAQNRMKALDAFVAKYPASPLKGDALTMAGDTAQ